MLKMLVLVNVLFLALLPHVRSASQDTEHASSADRDASKRWSSLDAHILSMIPGHHKPSSETSSSQQSESIASLKPRACGVLWFYHIPKTGGESVNNWLFQMKERGQFDDVYLLHNMSREVKVGEFINEKLEPLLADSRGKLVAVHHHDRATGLYNMSETFTGMKRRLESQGCNLYRMTFLREPMELLKATLVFYDSAEHNPGYEWVAPEAIRGINDSTSRLKAALATDEVYDNLMIRYILNNLGQGGPEPRVNNALYPVPIGEINRKTVTLARNVLREFQFIGFADASMNSTISAAADRLGLINTPGGLGMMNVYGVSQVNMAANTRLEEVDDAHLTGLLSEKCQWDKELYRIIRRERGVLEGEELNSNTGSISSSSSN